MVSLLRHSHSLQEMEQRNFRNELEINLSYLVGSSRKITGGLLTSSNAMASLFLWPPEISLSLVLAVSVKPRFSRISFIWEHIQIHKTINDPVRVKTDSVIRRSPGKAECNCLKSNFRPIFHLPQMPGPSCSKPD